MTEYNGYKNYNTWNIVLWLHNDEGAYSILARRAEIRRNHGTKWGPATAKRTATVIFEQCFGKAETPDGTKVCKRDISWSEVAEALNENI